MQPATAPAQPRHVPGEVVVEYRQGTTAAVRSATARSADATRVEATGPRFRTLQIGRTPIGEALRKLRRDPDVLAAQPNYIATVADFNPNDPGLGAPGDWRNLQWNFLVGAGVNAPAAWGNLIAAGRPGGTGVTIAVLDTGVAYRNQRPFRRAPDLEGTSFRRGYDFVAHDKRPFDQNGHGTHVASLIASRVNNNRGLTGLAYGVSILPVRVLNDSGQGSASNIATAIRYAARRGADVINMSLQFDPEMTAARIPQVFSAVNFAHSRGALIVAAAGNFGSSPVALPAGADNVVAVGATTAHRCLADYSNTGSGLDLVAPGGGDDSPLGDPGCDPASSGPGIFAQTYKSSFNFKRFNLSSEEGTSEAAPHVSATAALVIASGVLGASPDPDEIESRLEGTTADLGSPGYDSLYGWGLLDASAATTSG